MLALFTLIFFAQILSWFVSLHQCNSTAFMDMKPTDVVIFETFCSMCAQDWYTFTVLMSQHVNMKRLMYRVSLLLLDFLFLPVNKYLYCYKCLAVCKAQPEPKREKDHTYSVCLNVIFF